MLMGVEWQYGMGEEKRQRLKVDEMWFIGHRRESWQDNNRGDVRPGEDCSALLMRSSHPSPLPSSFFRIG